METEYERKRQENIRKNNEILAQLGLDTPVAAKPVPRKPAKRIKPSPKLKEPAVPTRVSLRTRGQDPNGDMAKTFIKEAEERQQAAAERRKRIQGPIKIQGSDPLFSDLLALKDEPAAKDEPTTKEEVGGKQNGTSSWKNQISSGTVKVTKDMIYCIAPHPSTTKLLAAVGDKWGAVQVWDIQDTLKQSEEKEDIVPKLYDFKPHVSHKLIKVGPVYQLAYAPFDVTKMYSCSLDGSIRCMDINAQAFTEVYVHPDETSIGQFDFGGTSVWFCTNDGTIGSVDERARTKPTLYTASLKKLNTIHVNPVNTSLVCVAGLDTTVRIYDVRNMKQKKNELDPIAVLDHSKSVNSAYWNSKGTTILSTSFDDTLGIWTHPTTTASIRKIKHNNNTGRWVQKFKAMWRPGTDSFVVGGMNRTVSVYDADGGVEEKLVDDGVTSIMAVNVFHPSSALILSGNSSGRMCIWKQ